MKHTLVVIVADQVVQQNSNVLLCMGFVSNVARVLLLACWSTFPRGAIPASQTRHKSKDASYFRFTYLKNYALRLIDGRLQVTVSKRRDSDDLQLEQVRHEVQGIDALSQEFLEPIQQHLIHLDPKTCVNSAQKRKGGQGFVDAEQPF